MKNILGIIGSPRKLGNSEIMAKEISRRIPIPHELKLIRLTDFNILPCKACYQCLFKEGKCALPDDLSTLMQAIADADALIVATPTYLLGANASFKRFLDRGLALFANIDKLWGKPAVGVGIAGIEGLEGYTLLNIESFISLIMAANKWSTIVYGALPGEVFLNEQNKKTAADLARALFGPARGKEGPSCPLCGGDTFRFIDKNRVRCMLCSNSGSFSTENGKPVFEIVKSYHDLFLNKESVIEHGKWLRNMKNRFLQQKDKLKEISIEYRKEGNWIKP